jgi:hypothetical protein
MRDFDVNGPTGDVDLSSFNPNAAIPLHWKHLQPGGTLLPEQSLRVASVDTLSKVEKRKLLP